MATKKLRRSSPSRDESTSPQKKQKTTSRSEEDSVVNVFKGIQPHINTEMPTSYEGIIPSPPVEGSVKIVSWNVNSLPASLKKGSLEYLMAEDADIVCLQETKLNAAQKDAYGLKSKYPYCYWNCGDRKRGYAGTAVLCKTEPLSHSSGFDPSVSGGLEDDEGRVITVEYETYFLVNCYVPNAGMKLERLDWKVDDWNRALKQHLKHLQSKGKAVIWTGDINVARDEIDLARPAQNRNKTPGFTDAERKSFEEFISDLELVDAWRHLNGKEAQRFTYFSYRFGARGKHLGWRLDYFMVPQTFMDNVMACDIREQVWGASDHVPLILTLKK